MKDIIRINSNKDINLNSNILLELTQSAQLTTFMFALKILPYINSDNVIGTSKGRPYSIDELGEILHENPKNVWKRMDYLRDLDVIKYEHIQVYPYNTCQKRVYIYNPWIYSKNNKIHLDILNMFKDSKWRSIVDSQLSERDTFDYVMWMYDVKQRDNNKCAVCGDNLDIEVHHISPFSEDYENRTNVDNGICLCKRHHSSKIIGSFHQTYGTRNNTKEQLQEYIDNKRNELGLPRITIDEIINK